MNKTGRAKSDLQNEIVTIFLLRDGDPDPLIDWILFDEFRPSEGVIKLIALMLNPVPLDPYPELPTLYFFKSAVRPHTQGRSSGKSSRGRRPKPMRDQIRDAVIADAIQRRRGVGEKYHAALESVANEAALSVPLVKKAFEDLEKLRKEKELEIK